MNASGEESASTLHNLMKLVDDLSYNHNFAANYITDADIGNRNDAVRWMQHCVEVVLDGDCPITRDTSVQIFDKFLMSCYSESLMILTDTEFLSYAAAASVILGAKLNDTKSKLTMAKFSNFDTDRLILFEQEILAMTSCKISPLCTPSNFLHHMVDISPLAQHKHSLLHNADLLIAEFLGDASAIMYAPSTIALSALLISFSHLKISCTTWLNSIPMYFFINDENPFFECALGRDQYGIPLSSTALFLDHERCIAAFERMHYLRSMRRSPVPNNGSASDCTTPCCSPTTTSSKHSDSVASPVSVSDQRALDSRSPACSQDP